MGTYTEIAKELYYLKRSCIAKPSLEKQLKIIRLTRILKDIDKGIRSYSTNGNYEPALNGLFKKYKKKIIFYSVIIAVVIFLLFL